MIGAITVGGATVDSIITVAGTAVERVTLTNAEKSYLMLEQGVKVDAEDVSQFCGGGALNAAVCLARLGLPTKTIIKLGSDPHGAMVRQRLAHEGVDGSWVRQSTEFETGASAIVSAHDRNAAIFTARGANSVLAAEDIVSDAFPNSGLAYIASLSGQSCDIFGHIIDVARSRSCTVVANPGVRQISRRFAELIGALPHIDILAVNRLEAETIAEAAIKHFGTQFSARARQALAKIAKGGEAANKTLIEALLHLGARSVLITDGKSGSHYATPDGHWFCPAEAVAVKGTVGAGDAFVSTFAAFLAGGCSADQSLAYAARNAASVVGYVDAQSGLLNRDALLAYFQSAEALV